jgi:hypothetical protein
MEWSNCNIQDNISRYLNSIYLYIKEKNQVMLSCLAKLNPTVEKLPGSRTPNK